ncbi:uncharacterized protein LOC116771478 [Danaus plexippus]|uniref:uncharacterized protein LOC116771478 n=1 Tax=Danaus plexippus TaxID=13037 RepID=UPI002AAF5A79|nr:uncharacterized protein LOC116771478 [Danaus plexippus]
MKFLRSLGLDYCDLPTILINVSVLLRVVTIKINSNDTQPVSWALYLIITICSSCYFFAYVVNLVWFVLVRCVETGDFITAMVALSLTFCSGTCLAKFLYMKMYTNTVMNLVDEYRLCDKLLVSDTRFAMNRMNNLRIIKKRAITVWLVLVTNAVIYLLTPLLSPGRHFAEDLYVLYGLEPSFETPNYQIIFAIEAASIFFSISTTVHITVFIIVIVGCIEAQLLALSEELENMWEDSAKFYERYGNGNERFSRNVFLKMRLQDIAKLHIVTINLRQNVDKELRFLFVVDCIFMILAIVTELVGGLENTIVQFPFTIAIVFIDCFIGQKLIDASDVFESSIYGCRWENFDVHNQKTVLFMLKNSQKTLYLSAGGIAVLNMSCLMCIFRTTYSAYTTLQTSG